MKRFFLPIVLLLIGIGGGVAAGLVFSPPEDAHQDLAAGCEDTGDSGDPGSLASRDADPIPAIGGSHVAVSESDDDSLGGGFEYVRLNNQFVVPIVESSSVSALVLLSISVEVPEGEQEAVLLVEPKLRDIFLQVLFDHANTGGFEGVFTSTANMRTLRNALLRAAQDALGSKISDVLIVDIVRQDV
jgi:hypothetical protein